MFGDEQRELEEANYILQTGVDTLRLELENTAIADAHVNFAKYIVEQELTSAQDE